MHTVTYASVNRGSLQLLCGTSWRSTSSNLFSKHVMWSCRRKIHLVLLLYDGSTTYDRCIDQQIIKVWSEVLFSSVAAPLHSARIVILQSVSICRLMTNNSWSLFLLPDFSQTLHDKKRDDTSHCLDCDFSTVTYSLISFNQWTT